MTPQGGNPCSPAAAPRSPPAPQTGTGPRSAPSPLTAPPGPGVPSPARGPARAGPGAVGPAAQRAAGREAPGTYFVYGAREQAIEQAAQHHAVLQGGLKEALGVGDGLFGRLQHAQGDQPRNGLLRRIHGDGGGGRGSRRPAPRVGFVSPPAGASGGGRRRRPHVNADDDAPAPPLQTHAAAVPPPPRPPATAAAAAAAP